MINSIKKRTIFGAVAGVALIAIFSAACSSNDPPPTTMEPDDPSDMMQPINPPEPMQPTPPIDAPFANLNGYSDVTPTVASVQEFINSLDDSISYQAHFETEQGTFVAELYPECSPQATAVFIHLAESGFYDNTTFHRVIPGFVAQGGDPTGTGTGGPGFGFADPTCPERRHNAPGILSFANSGAPNTNGSQFFITLADTPSTRNLDTYDANGDIKNCGAQGVSCHPVFGRVIEGFDEFVTTISERNPATATTPGDTLITIDIVQANANGEFVEFEEFIPNVHDAEAFLESFDTSLDYEAEFQTSAGNFTAELYPQCSPISVSNFVYLAENGFYENTTFHRVVDGFVIQGGDPTATGAGGPSYSFGDLSCNDYTHNTLGVLSMANRGSFNTNGSQFFVTISTTAIDRLDVYNSDGTIKECTNAGVSCHPIFGRVTSGMDVVNSVEVGTELISVSVSSN